MRIFKKCSGLLGLIALSGCNVMNLSTSNQPQMGADRGFDSKPLTELKAGIWLDPNGCQHWIIDDGIEGYLSQRLQPDGRPVCTDDYPINAVVGNQTSGDTILGDLI